MGDNGDGEEDQQDDGDCPKGGHHNTQAGNDETGDYVYCAKGCGYKQYLC